MKHETSRYPKWKRDIFDLDHQYAGPCGMCGASDKRHRMYDAIAGRLKAGDSPSSIVNDMGLSPLYVAAILAKVEAK